MPIVEPEVLMDGPLATHDIDTLLHRHRMEALKAVFQASSTKSRMSSLEGMVLKPNMVISGSDCPDQAGIEEVAYRTVQSLKRTVPAAVPGIVFLSGGQSDEVATQHLNAMNRLDARAPWQLSFSYGRALQAAPLKAWGGENANRAAAQAAFLERAKANGEASLGRYA